MRRRPTGSSLFSGTLTQAARCRRYLRTLPHWSDTILRSIRYREIPDYIGFDLPPVFGPVIMYSGLGSESHRRRGGMGPSSPWRGRSGKVVSYFSTQRLFHSHSDGFRNLNWKVDTLRATNIQTAVFRLGKGLD
jgi:hypothetical protein